ncbi:pesticin C-terminus-like muramidase [Marivita sp. S0852]|uniref:pesticin C-terminus-like muramidase n=1 Tax=Marivita sp. S0852 TaxID=3373893 RepID=UPI003981AD60
MSFDIDWNFIARQEGEAVTTGYVPMNAQGAVFGQSGVTIATGFDIGQHSISDLNRLFGQHPDIIALLTPYVGLKRMRAVEALRAQPLTITDAQASIIDRAVKTAKARAIATTYDAAVASTFRPTRQQRTAPTFRSLPREAQTVIMSVAFQYGSLPTRTPTFWRYAVQQDWRSMERELRNFGDEYTSRRIREADYLLPLNMARASN